MSRLAALLILLYSASAVQAKTIKVLVDIAPLHSLVSMVMEDTGQPDLLLPAHASAHHFSMRPSQARLLADADVIFWVGPSLTPWLDDGIAALFQGHPVAMLGNEAQTFRAEHDDHEGEAHDEEDAHGHTIDPHAWLDPKVATIWLGRIADELSALDPDNSASYAKRAGEAQKKIEAMGKDIADKLAPFQGQPYLTDHDSFQYFEKRFGLTFAGAITDGDDAPPSAAHVEELIETAHQARCFIATSPNPITRTIMDGARIETSFTLDPLGRMMKPGSDLYPTLMLNLTETIQSCMEASS